MTRWTLGASDIMFTNPLPFLVVSSPLPQRLFRISSGRARSSRRFRGTGIYQPAIDIAIE
ncbi:hypothetical protein EDB89DRAFT_1979216 [Lactarius sanguifluus]|nr:hypothetical protein EDB89DRAFT_1979216 [Lactarius sanguifluus]